MKDIENWMGLYVPVSDNNKMRHRRVLQGGNAMDEIKKQCPPDKRKVVVQAGGNWGYWPLLLADIFDTVYTFEPDPICFSALAANTARKKNVVRIQAALGFERGLVDLDRQEKNTGNNKVSGEGIYPTLRIDDLSLMECDLIYLDVEGQEYEALLGAVNTIFICEPLVIFECKRESFKGSVGRTVGFLKENGYRQSETFIGSDTIFRKVEETC